MEILVVGSMAESVKPKVLNDGLPLEIRDGLARLLLWIDCGDMSAWRQSAQFRPMHAIRKLRDDEAETKSREWGIFNQIVNSLKHISDDEVIAFVRRDLVLAKDVINAAYVARYVKAGASIAFLQKRIKEEDAAFAEFGYRCYRFTDPGSDLILEGNNQRCRFCGKLESDGATFNKDAHVISYFLGNHHLLGHGECDECNARFGRDLEPHLHRYYLPTMMAEGFTGRGKNANIAGTNFKQDMQSMEYYPDAIEQADLERLVEGKEVWLTQEDKQTVTKANIYRILSKFVVSVLPESELSAFERTVGWINGKITHGRLPEIYRYEKLDCTDVPDLHVLIDNGIKYGVPHCIAVFKFISNLWIYAVPYTSGCKNDNMSGTLKRFVRRFFPQLKFTRERFDDEIGTYTQTHFTCLVGPETRVRRYVDMTPEEKAEFHRNTDKSDVPVLRIIKH